MGALTTLADRSVAKLTEEEIIRRVVQSLSDAAPAFPEGPGGDCAHLPTTGGRSIRASTIDSVILGRHFDAACDGIRAGVKLVNRNLSDLAAAGAVPSDALLSLVIGADVDTWRFFTIALAVTIGAPIMEELAFRGMIYPGLRRLGAASATHGRWIAVCITGALFSAAHLSPSAALPLFAFGAFMCLVRDRYGLITCMAIHCCFNGWNLLWLKLAPNASTL